MGGYAKKGCEKEKEEGFPPLFFLFHTPFLGYNYKTTTRQLQDNYKTTTRQLQDNYKTTTRQLQDNYKTTTRQLQMMIIVHLPFSFRGVVTLRLLYHNTLAGHFYMRAQRCYRYCVCKHRSCRFSIARQDFDHSRLYI